MIQIVWGIDPGTKTCGLGGVAVHDDGRIDFAGAWQLVLKEANWKEIISWLLVRTGSPVVIEDYNPRRLGKAAADVLKVVGALQVLFLTSHAVDYSVWHARWAQLRMAHLAGGFPDWCPHDLPEHARDAAQLAAAGAALFHGGKYL